MREHIEQLHPRNPVTGQVANVFRHRLGVAAGVDNKLWRHLAQVVAQRLTDTAARRVYQHQLRHVALAGGELRRVERLEVQIRQPQFRGGLGGAGDRLGGDLNPGQLHLRGGAVQAKAADAAEEIPHMVNRQTTHPVACGGVQLACHGRVGLEEAFRADPQRHVVKTLCQRLSVGEEDLLFPFHDRHMHRLNIGGNHLQLRQLFL